VPGVERVARCHAYRSDVACWRYGEGRIGRAGREDRGRCSVLVHEWRERVGRTIDVSASWEADSVEELRMEVAEFDIF